MYKCVNAIMADAYIQRCGVEVYVFCFYVFSELRPVYLGAVYFSVVSVGCCECGCQ